jgi:hypothetical protein
MNTRRMLLRAACLLGISVLAGCAVESNFTRVNTSSTQLHMDFVQCEDNSKVQYPVRMEEVEPAHWTPEKTRCITNKDNNQTTCETKAPVLIPARYDDVNFSARQGSLVDCMEHSGYTRKALPF